MSVYINKHFSPSIQKTMLNFFKKNPSKKLEKEYNSLLEKARDAQRAGDIKLFATISAQAEEVWTKIETLRTNG